MTRDELQIHWNNIVLEAYHSGKTISQWCREKGIRTNHFYRWSKKLGYTSNGQRTEKCSAAEEQNRQKTVPLPDSAPIFVEVSAQTLGRVPKPAESFLLDQPLITIQTGNYKIGIQDGFNDQTLSKVLEVIRYA